ncbi:MULTISPECIES: DNA mismatch repair endonuclease MutL [Ruminococcus]|uniref:DNA mismatch repair protein MutL n=1 Tax=Ruminococcus bovis TaxID=2564099 RepID=A0A4P8Y3C9_9FIRM|nr:MULTISPECIES: DNA mismatch repair endonuclease MutL [Ruminococcus]MEE3438462.1 DNA mismatch repair endonuclease MutL [Ruminococcus sp.]QCT07838.1 DNA mismatch repair endonuclease MutL [Ruminococcus bovis]
MGRINVLDKHTAELIAAGEVVERPSSVVKELLENSIDAGATQITVEIMHGGIDYLRITDNGCGILKEDVRNAFKRNATSKISVDSDLEKIGTLGFRGEALASISSVSKVQLITKAKEENIGSAYEIDGGEEISFDDAGCPDGTTLIMRNLFYNVPARYKFLKKDVAEGNAVASVIDKIALSHPEIAITFIRDNKRVLKTAGDGKLMSSIYAVYGRDFASTLIPVDYELNGMKLTGYISRPTNGRANRNMQNTFINGRFVKSRTISVALEEACKGSIMIGKFPSCVLNLQISPEAVDVNVHPAKIEVRFINERPVFDTVYHGVKSALLRGDSRKEAVLNHNNTVNIKPLNPFNLANKVINKEPTKSVQKAPEKPREKSIFDELDLPTKTVKYNKVNKVSDSSSVQKKYMEFLENNKKLSENNQTTNNSLCDNIDNNAENNVSTESKIETKINEVKEDTSLKQEVQKVNPFEELELEKITKDENIITEEKKSDVDVVLPTERQTNSSSENIEIKTLIDEDKQSFRFIGEAMNTYIIVETDNNKLVLIDKHAAHERIIFEKLKREKGTGSVQLLLIPITVTLEKNEYTVAIEHLYMFKNVGFDVEDFGNGTLIVRSAPSYLRNDDIEDTIIEICGYIAENRKNVMSEHMEWIYHNISCRSAIKAGDSSTAKELIDIAKTVFSDDSIRYCPHGRPVCIELSKYEIEKQFGRA